MTLEDILPGTLPFFIVSMVALMIFILLPALSTFLPGRMFRW